MRPMSLTPGPPDIPPRPPDKDPKSVLVSQSWEGPLPPPGILRGYEDICPGAADRLIKMVEDQGEHRRSLENLAFDTQREGMCREFAEARLGQTYAFVISALFLGCGTFAALHGQPWVGTIFGAFGIGGIVTTFIQGRNKAQGESGSEDRQQPESKRDEPPKRKRPRR